MAGSIEGAWCVWGGVRVVGLSLLLPPCFDVGVVCPLPVLVLFVVVCVWVVAVSSQWGRSAIVVSSSWN
jgi:hypothetical protein